VSLVDQLLQAEFPGTILPDLHASPTPEILDHCERGGFCSQDCIGIRLDNATE